MRVKRAAEDEVSLRTKGSERTQKRQLVRAAFLAGRTGLESESGSSIYGNLRGFRRVRGSNCVT